MRFKILYAMNRARVAGTERHVLYFLKHLNRDLFQPAVVFFSDGPLLQQLNENGVRAYALPRRRFLDFGHLTCLRALIREHKFDLVHSHSGQLACLAGRLAGVAHTIETRHGLCVDYNHLDSHLRRDAAVARLKAAQVSKTLLVSQSDYEIMRDIYRVPARKLRWVANGIDFDDISPAPDNLTRLRSELGLAPKTKLVGTVARLEPQKGVAYLIRAITLLSANPKKIRLVVVGDGALRDELAVLAANLGISDFVIFTGYRSDARDIMSLFDVFVLPSLWEGLPYTILEAMALKKPVVATNVFGNRETVLDGETGYLIPPRDPEAIANAIGTLLCSPGKAGQMGNAGFERVRACFSAEKMTREIENIYLQLLTSGSRQ